MKLATQLTVASIVILVFALVRGFLLLEFGGAFLFSLFGAGSVFALICSARAFSARRRISGLFFAGISFLILVPVAVPHACFSDYPYMVALADIQRRTRFLERELRQHPDFSTVRLEFMAPSGTKQRWVQVTGSLKSKAEFETLMRHVDQLDFPIRYSLIVDGTPLVSDGP